MCSEYDFLGQGPFICESPKVFTQIKKKKIFKNKLNKTQTKKLSPLLRN